jgi:hypothetical protein
MGGILGLVNNDSTIMMNQGGGNTLNMTYHNESSRTHKEH